MKIRVGFLPPLKGWVSASCLYEDESEEDAGEDGDDTEDDENGRDGGDE